MTDKTTWPGWATVESDPVIFTAILRNLDVQWALVKELYTLEPQDDLGTCYGLIFLFRWKDESTIEGTKREEIHCPEDIWFANQVVENACASLALLNIVLNVPGVELERFLAPFKEFTKDFSPALRGLSLTNFEPLRRVHNAYARRSDMLDADYALMSAASKKRRIADEEEDEAFHFVAYIPKNGSIWELDGLKRTPVKLSAYQGDWTTVALRQIEERISRYNSEADEEIRFNLLAVCRNTEVDQTEQLHKEDDQKREDDIYIKRREHDYLPFVLKYLELLHKKEMLQDLLT